MEQPKEVEIPVHATPDKKISLTDSDARSMANKRGGNRHCRLRQRLDHASEKWRIGGRQSSTHSERSRHGWVRLIF
jgi:hypothetical protein